MPYRRSPEEQWRLALFLVFILVLWLLIGTGIAHGQTGSPSEPPSLSGLLATSEANLALLALRLTERQQQVQTLRDSLAQAEQRLAVSQESLETLRSQLQTAERSLEQLQMDLRVTLISHEELWKQYNTLDSSWQAYRIEAKKQIGDLQRERDRAKVWGFVFLGVSVAGVVTSLILAVK